MDHYKFKYSYDGAEGEGTVEAADPKEARAKLKEGIVSAHGEVKNLKITIGRKPVGVYESPFTQPEDTDDSEK